ncbi:MAG: GNAT family N-acetyltransferase [Actinomycetota bacterium]|nr:GNAT family N-acetyltransferase [Actinomycetota bacterium]
MSLPADDLGWRDLSRAGMAPCWREMAEGSGGSVWERGEVLAAIVPKAPTRSVFNSVFYEDGGLLLSSLDEIAAAYERAGIAAWTVWVPEADAATAAGLERAGHVLDSEPRYMGMALSELREPPAATGFEIREAEDYAEMARLNEIAYGYPPSDFAAVAEAPMGGIRIWFAELDGERVCTLATLPHGDDAVVIWVATVPEARGRGIARSLLFHALRAARSDGLETTTLQSSKLGAPVYERLGYRDFGAAQMWERRKT